MKRFFWLLMSFLFLAACGASESAVSSSASSATAVSPTDAPAPTNVPAPTVASNDASLANPLATASIIRESDWVRGAAEPIVTIIEYGDFQ